MAMLLLRFLEPLWSSIKAQGVPWCPDVRVSQTSVTLTTVFQHNVCIIGLDLSLWHFTWDRSLGIFSWEFSPGVFVSELPFGNYRVVALAWWGVVCKL